MKHVTAERAAVLYTRAVAKRAIYQIVSVFQKTDENFLQDFPQQIPKGTLFLKEDHGLARELPSLLARNFFSSVLVQRVLQELAAKI